ncbi:MAG: SUMF1/EgtB/PvdO family nonheme iron enzyme [Phormidesmis sp.]
MGKFALLIGVSNYAEGLSALPAAVQDVVAVQRILADPALGNFDDVQLLTDPSRDEMTSGIELWLNERKADDTTLLFFSGHGLKDDRRELYFATSSTRKVGDQLVRSTAMAARSLNDFLRYSRSRQQVVILDCCFSGAFGELVARDDGEIELEAQLAAEGRVVLTSTSAVDYAFETKAEELSVYTRYLVEGIEKGTADLNGDGFITVDELHQFACRKVKETAPAMSPDIIMLQGRGHDIRLASAPQEKPELRYRKEVERRSRKGKFTPVGRRLLTSFRQACGLTDSAAEVIEAEVLKPFRDYQRKLQEYREALAECLEDEPALGRDHVIDLKDYQKYLGLKNADVKLIEQELAGRTLVVEEPPSIPTTVSVSESRPELTYPTFSFETVRVNAQGTVIETILGEAECFSEDLGNGVTLEMVRIPGGKFLMGAAEGEEGSYEQEYPQHEVTVPAFWMGKFAVTQEQWAAVAALNQIDCDLNEDPARFKGAKRPVEQVSWQDAMEFCKRLSQRSQWVYSLPSEAQWEYACRAGTTTPFHFGSTITTDLANYRGTDYQGGDTTYLGNYGEGPKGDYREKTTEVGSFKPNGFGLHDMHGNLWEWCQDGWHDSYTGAPKKGGVWKSSTSNNKVVRGGSWINSPGNCRSAFRYDFTPDIRNYTVGFRVSCSAPRT